MPSFSAILEASLVGFCIEAITCLNPAKVDSTGTPAAVTDEIEMRIPGASSKASDGLEGKSS